MKLLVLEPVPSFVGGSERMSFALSRHAREKGVEVTLGYCVSGDMLPAYKAAGVAIEQCTLTPLAVRHPCRAWNSINTLNEIVRRAGAQIVFTSQISYVSLLAALQFRARIKTAVHLGLVYDFNSPLFRWGMRRVSLGVAPSAHTAKDWSQRGWPAASLRTIPNGIDINIFSPGHCRSEQRSTLALGPTTEPLILYMGRLVEAKGIFTLMRAFAIWRNQNGRGHLAFIGAAAHDEIRQLHTLAAESGLPAGAWEIRGPASQPEDFYRAADLVVVPSEWDEPFGLVPLEAMACGTLAIVSDRGVLPEFVEPAQGDCVFRAGNAESLAACLNRWLNDNAGRALMAATLKAHVNSRYNFERCGDAYLEEFTRLLATPAA